MIDDGLCIAIFNWGNHYADGSSEAGLFAIGHDRFGVGSYANTAGELITTSDIGGTMPNLASPAQELDGRMRRVGDERVPEVWFWWGESIPANGTKRSTIERSAEAVFAGHK